MNSQAHLPLTHHQIRILLALNAAQAPMDTEQLCEALKIPSDSLTGSLRGVRVYIDIHPLKEKGYLNKDPSDGTLTLTEKGKEAATSFAAEVAEYEEEKKSKLFR